MIRNFGPIGFYAPPKPVYRPGIVAWLLAAALWIVTITLIGWAAGWL